MLWMAKVVYHPGRANAAAWQKLDILGSLFCLSNFQGQPKDPKLPSCAAAGKKNAFIASCVCDQIDGQSRPPAISRVFFAQKVSSGVIKLVDIEKPDFFGRKLYSSLRRFPRNVTHLSIPKMEHQGWKFITHEACSRWQRCRSQNNNVAPPAAEPPSLGLDPDTPNPTCDDHYPEQKHRSRWLMLLRLGWLWQKTLKSFLDHSAALKTELTSILVSHFPRLISDFLELEEQSEKNDDEVAAAAAGEGHGYYANNGWHFCPPASHPCGSSYLPSFLSFSPFFHLMAKTSRSGNLIDPTRLRSASNQIPSTHSSIAQLSISQEKFVT